MKKFLFTSSIVLLAAFVVACGLRGGHPGGDKSPQPAETIVAATPSLPSTIKTAQVAATAFADGTWEVRKDITPGLYVTRVPAGQYSFCLWQRLSGFSGSDLEILSSGTGNAGSQQMVTIKASDKGFLSMGCGTWKLKK